mmetsp:Transcript_28390/g.76907  ORF Transcript_28390/g.76907 Transcript_28390/m.76907 type:complete len:821 (+) Transcript_28390:115-2577(+)
MTTVLSATFAALLILSSLRQTSHAEPLWSDVCREDETKNLPFCDMTIDLDERILDYVNRIPIETKISMMGHNASGYEPLKIPPYMWWSEGLHGPLEPCVEYKGQCVCPTNFPSPSAMGNAFNRTLYRMVGHAIGIQGRAISNLRLHKQDLGDGLTYWSPTINMQRDPRWGRNQEVPGEDPFLTSQYSKAFVRALQGTGLKDDKSEQSKATSISDGDDDRSDLRMAACCKHFLGNSLEHWGTYDRHSFNAEIDDYDLNNYYLPPFEECTKYAVGVMCSYNAVNGEPACASNWLLKDVLRERMNFTGYLVTDCGALSSIVHGHHFAIDYVQASTMAKNASVDINCGSIFQDSLVTAYTEGRVDEVTINDSFQRMARIQFRLGLFDSNKKSTMNPDVDVASIDSSQHQQLALEAALQSIVLLKNENNRLPLDKNERKSLAVIGPHINAHGALMGNYHGAKCGCRSDGGINKDFSCVESPLQAITGKVKFPDQVKSMMGCSITDETISDIEKAIELARNSDTVILVLGLDQGQESEGHDRNETTLPGLQPKLMEGILDIAGDKTIIVLIHGGTVSLGDEKDKAGAILSAGYGGQAGSSAIANVLFGDYNPTGKLAATVYPPTFVDELPLTEMGLRVGVGRTYMYYTGEAEFTFGHGLSYSNWKLDWVNSVDNTESKGGNLPSLKLQEFMPSRIYIRVTNLGPHTASSSQTILMFWCPSNDENDDTKMHDFVAVREKKERKLRRKLINFQGTNYLLPGESHTLEFELTWKDFTMWNPGKNASSVSLGNYELVAQASDTILTRRLEIVASNSNEHFSRLRHPETVS